MNVSRKIKIMASALAVAATFASPATADYDSTYGGEVSAINPQWPGNTLILEADDKVTDGHCVVAWGKNLTIGTTKTKKSCGAFTSLEWDFGNANNSIKARHYITGHWAYKVESITAW